MNTLYEAIDIAVATRFKVHKWAVSIKKNERAIKWLSGQLTILFLVVAAIVWIFTSLASACIVLGGLMALLWISLVVVKRISRKYDEAIENVIEFVNQYTGMIYTKTELEGYIVAMYLNNRALDILSEVHE